ncbi:sugar-transfer associated ATP-grasp domain-containing protein [Alkalicoccus luteus]|uniref:sugar-transfer associated ATP-grasp domain-containing protein n=1 Tax=Alkalicoccus luteus TaxID=1237094 RepID=UPI004033F562
MEKNNNTFSTLGIRTDEPAFKRYQEAGLLEEIDETFLQETVKTYWEPFLDEEVDTSIHAAFQNVSGYAEKRVVPQRVMWDIVMPFLNDMSMKDSYSDKNLYDILFQAERSPETYLKRIDYKYYNGHNRPLSRQEAESIMLKSKEAIVKPSNRDNGMGIKKIRISNKSLYTGDKKISLKELENEVGSHFIVQEVIKQHPVMAEPHPESVNTLRMVTLRWNNEIHYCLTFARFGTGGAVQDNAGTGGVCVGISDDGEFLKQAVDEHAHVMKKHPTTGFDFENTNHVIPNFDEYIHFVKKLHEKVLHHHFVSWDIAVGSEGEPIFLEANFRGATWLYQLASQKPVLGDFTTAIFEEIARLKASKEIDLLKVSPSAATSKKKIRNLRKRVRRLKQEIESKEHEIQKIEMNINNLEQSVSELNKKKRSQRKKIKQLQQEIQEWNKWKEDLINSKYWKASAPLRKVLK